MRNFADATSFGGTAVSAVQRRGDRGAPKFVLTAVFLFFTSILHADIRKDVAFLAADEQEGRGLGTKGLARAAGYLETRMRAIGLPPRRTTTALLLARAWRSRDCCTKSTSPPGTGGSRRASTQWGCRKMATSSEELTQISC